MDWKFFKWYDIGTMLKQVGFHFSCDAAAAVYGDEVSSDMKEECRQCMMCHGYDLNDCSEVLTEWLQEHGYSYIISETNVMLLKKDDKITYHDLYIEETSNGDMIVIQEEK